MNVYNCRQCSQMLCRRDFQSTCAGPSVQTVSAHCINRDSVANPIAVYLFMTIIFGLVVLAVLRRVSSRVRAIVDNGTGTTGFKMS